MKSRRKSVLSFTVKERGSWCIEARRGKVSLKNCVDTHFSLISQGKGPGRRREVEGEEADINDVVKSIDRRIIGVC